MRGINRDISRDSNRDTNRDMHMTMDVNGDITLSRCGVLPSERRNLRKRIKEVPPPHRSGPYPS